MMVEKIPKKANFFNEKKANFHCKSLNASCEPAFCKEFFSLVKMQCNLEEERES